MAKHSINEKAKYLDGTYITRRCKKRLRIEAAGKTLRQDPYTLAYRYVDYMTAHPKRPREGFNLYFEKLLANQPDPEPDANDDRSRAIWYAKEHYESYYEIGDIARIVGWLDEAEEKQSVSGNGNSIDLTTLLAGLGCPSQRAHETSSLRSRMK